jgi:hypothetical protein
VKDRTVFAECRRGAHEMCAGHDAASECACWHHVQAARRTLQISALIRQVEFEVGRIWRSLTAPGG